MPTLSRRRLLARATALAATQLLHKFSLAQAADAASRQGDAMVPIHVSVAWNQAVTTVPHEMLGLSYESSQLAAADFFSSANTELIELFRQLSPRGVLRLGGNLSEFTRWMPDAEPAASDVPFRAVTPDPSAGKGIAPVPVTPAAIRNLREFLDGTGWQAIYGLNLALADRERVAAEARFVAETLGSRLIAFQIGNEPNHYVLNRLRAPGYSFTDYFSEWSRIHDAVHEALPQARFAGPDIAEEVSWVKQFAASAPKSVVMLTGHHYAEGPPGDPSVTIEKLLAPDQGFERHLADIEAVTRQARMPYVMAETNSCYNAGKPGVSDVFASALWAADYILQVAQARQQGIYFHGGGTGWYTPIAGGSGKPFEPRPVYYGLLLCRELLGSEMAPAKLEAGSGNVCAYGFRHPRRIVVINKDMRDVVVHFEAGDSAVQARRLLAPSLDARTDIRLSMQQLMRGEQRAVRIPAHSAAILTMKTV
jgi:hypothetical protein